MTDELTPPHWGIQEMPTQQMTGDEINAMVERLETVGDVPVSAIIDAITTLRAQLTAETARADARVAAAFLAAAGECYDREDARAIARLATQPQTDALQAMIDAAVKEAWEKDAELLKEVLERLEYADQFIRHNRGGGGLHNPARTETIAKLRAKIGGAS